jgi:hypothetical protein
MGSIGFDRVRSGSFGREVFAVIPDCWKLLRKTRRRWLVPNEREWRGALILFLLSRTTPFREMARLNGNAGGEQGNKEDYPNHGFIRNRLADQHGAGQRGKHDQGPVKQNGHEEKTERGTDDSANPCVLAVSQFQGSHIHDIAAGQQTRQPNCNLVQENRKDGSDQAQADRDCQNHPFLGSLEIFSREDGSGNEANAPDKKPKHASAEQKQGQSNEHGGAFSRVGLDSVCNPGERICFVAVLVKFHSFQNTRLAQSNRIEKAWFNRVRRFKTHRKGEVGMKQN